MGMMWGTDVLDKGLDSGDRGGVKGQNKRTLGNVLHNDDGEEKMCSKHTTGEMGDLCPAGCRRCC